MSDVDKKPQGRNRTILIVAALFGVALCVAAWFQLSGRGTNATGAPSEVAPSPINPEAPINVDPAEAKNDPRYAQLQAVADDAAIKEAQADGRSAVPSIKLAKPEEATEVTAPDPVPAMPTVPPESEAQVREREEAARARQAAEQQEEAAYQSKVAAMKAQYNLLIKNWEARPHVAALTVTTDPARDTPPVISHVADSSVSGGNSESTTAPTTKGKEVVIARAGDTLYAVLEVGVNTDTPSELTARVLSEGPFKNAKLVGKHDPITGWGQRVRVSFDRASLAGLRRSVQIEAVAQDLGTKQASLADDVNNHYVQKSFSALGSGVLSGVSDALLKGGQDETQTQTANGTVTVRKSYDGKTVGLIALGNTGKQVTTYIEPIMRRPATITVYPNKGIGILFLNDVVVNED